MDRGENMRRIRSTDSAPEMAVRRLIHHMGYRYRLHDSKLPGRPDLIFASRGKIIFVHGCFWHCHAGCPTAHIPKTRREYWQPKLNRNRARDKSNEHQLRELGWNVLTIWECEIGKGGLPARIKDFLQ